MEHLPAAMLPSREPWRNQGPHQAVGCFRWSLGPAAGAHRGHRRPHSSAFPSGTVAGQLLRAGVRAILLRLQRDAEGSNCSFQQVSEQHKSGTSQA